jgi:hypothetical protein
MRVINIEIDALAGEICGVVPVIPLSDAALIEPVSRLPKHGHFNCS